MKLLFSIFLFGVCSYASCQQPATNPLAAGNDTAYQYRQASADGIGKFYMGREIAHVMGAAGSDWLERPSRIKEENTLSAIEKMPLKPNTVVADIGAGTGFYTFKIAPKVSQGMVYAVELQQEYIDHLSNRKKENGLKNITVVKSDTMHTNLPPGSIDLAVMVDVYHEFSWPKEMINSISESLKPDGKILLIEYKGEDPSIGIKPLHKTTVAQLKKEFGASGFRLARHDNSLPIQHLLIFERDR